MPPKNLPKSKLVDWAARTLLAEFPNTTYGTLQLRQATVARNVQIVKHDPGADNEYWAVTNAYFAKSWTTAFTEAKQEHDRARATLAAAHQQDTSLDAAGAARVLEEAKRLAEAASRTETAEHEKLKTRVLEVWGRITGGATSRADMKVVSPALAAAQKLRVDTSQAAADEAARDADGSPRSAPQRSPLEDAEPLRNNEANARQMRRNRFYGSYYARVEGSAVGDNRDVDDDEPGVEPMDLGDDAVAAPAPVEPLKLPESVLPMCFFETPARSDVTVTMDRMLDHVVDKAIISALLEEVVQEVQDSVASLTAVAPSTNPHRLLQNAALKERLKNTIIDEQPEGESDMVQTPGGRVATVVEHKAGGWKDVILDENKNDEGGAGECKTIRGCRPLEQEQEPEQEQEQEDASEESGTEPHFASLIVKLEEKASYYYEIFGKTFGPFQSRTMERWAAEGKFAADMRVLSWTPDTTSDVSLLRDFAVSAQSNDAMDLGDEAVAEEPSAALGDDAVAAPAPVEPLKLPERVLPVRFFETPAQSDVTVTMDRVVDHVAHDTKLVDPEIRATVESLVAETAGPDDEGAAATTGDAYLEARADEFLKMVEDGEVSLSSSSRWGSRERWARDFGDDVLNTLCGRFDIDPNLQKTGDCGKIDLLSQKLKELPPPTTDAPPPGSRRTRAICLNEANLRPIDPCYFAANDSGFDWNSYEISATPAAWQERLAYKFAFQKWKPFFLCGCLCLTALTYATGNLAVAMLFTLAYGATAVSNGHVVAVPRDVVERLVDTAIARRQADLTLPRGPSRADLARALKYSKLDCWTHHDVFVRIPSDENRLHRVNGPRSQLLAEIRAGAIDMGGNLKATCVVSSKILDCELVALVGCSRKFTRELRKPTRREASTWLEGADALGAATTSREREAAQRAIPMKYNPTTKRGIIKTSMDLKGLSAFCRYNVPRVKALAAYLEVWILEAAERAGVCREDITEEIIEHAYFDLQGAPNAEPKSPAFEPGMVARVKDFVQMIRDKIVELPRECPTWHWNGGKIPLGNWPANRVNAADKQYSQEALNAP